MNRLGNRISKLESRNPTADAFPAVFVSFCAENEPDDCRWIIVPNVGGIWREDGEPVAEFRRRGYAMQEAQKHVDDMTEDELKAALLAADELIMSKQKEAENID